MSDGLVITNDFGAIQIDGVMRNFEVISSGIAASTYSETGGSRGAYVSASFNDITFPIVMFRPPNGVAAGGSYFLNTNTMFINTSGAAYNVPYMLLKESNPPVESLGYGVEVFNQSSTKVFSSTQKIFNVDAILSYQPTASNLGATFSLPTPEFGVRYFQAMVRGGAGEGDDIGLSITRTGENSVYIYALYAQQGAVYGPIQQNVTILTGYGNL